MKVIKRITLVITKFIDGEFLEKKVIFDSFDKLKEFLLSHPDLKYVKLQIWRIDDPSAQEDLF